MIQNILKKLLSTLLIGAIFIFFVVCPTYAEATGDKINLSADVAVGKDGSLYLNGVKQGETFFFDVCKEKDSDGISLIKENEQLEQKLARVKKRREKLNRPSKFFECLKNVIFKVCGSVLLMSIVTLTMCKNQVLPNGVRHCYFE